MNTSLTIPAIIAVTLLVGAFAGAFGVTAGIAARRIMPPSVRRTGGWVLILLAVVSLPVMEANGYVMPAQLAGMALPAFIAGILDAPMPWRLWMLVLGSLIYIALGPILMSPFRQSPLMDMLG